MTKPAAPDAHLPSPRRWQLLGAPIHGVGLLACLPAGDPRRHDRFRHYTTLAEFNQPMTRARIAAAQAWAVFTFDL